MAGKKNKSKKNESPILTPPASVTKNSPKDKMEIDGAGDSEELKVYLPGMPLEDGEQLEADPSAYVMLHDLNAEWPCLSFDVVRDSGSDERSSFPMEGFMVTGTQADQRSKNQLLLLRCSNLTKTFERDENAESDGEEEDDDDDESDESEKEEEEEDGKTRGEGKRAPRHYCISIPHDGGVNRIRSSNVVVDGNLKHVLAATWSETGKVFIWDLQNSYAELSSIASGSPSCFLKRPTKPIHVVNKHNTEGFALCWSPIVPGRLLSGDCNGSIYMTEPVGVDRLETQSESFRGHSGSVEDLQWSPSEATVFASSSCDRSIRLWDIRLPRHQSALAAIVHDSDVNVISWNKHSTHLIASGADDGSFATWDLRKWTPSTELSVPSQPVNKFNWHKDSITSIEWSPHDSSILAVSGADDQLTIWDFAVDETLAEYREVNGVNVPAQLLFIHQGQKEIKELHWHPQLCGVLFSTALSGFNIFKTISV